MYRKTWFLLAATAILTVGCVTPPPDVCSAPSGKRIDAAFATARESLEYEQCWSHFDQYFDQLLGIAEGDPGPANLKRFSDYISLSLDRGIITRVKSQNLYTRYFSTTFVSLPTDRSSCSVARKFDTIQVRIDDELRAKYRGLSKVAGSSEKYARAQREKRDIEEIFLALKSACE